MQLLCALKRDEDVEENKFTLLSTLKCNIENRIKRRAHTISPKMFAPFITLKCACTKWFIPNRFSLAPIHYNLSITIVDQWAFVCCQKYPLSTMVNIARQKRSASYSIRRILRPFFGNRKLCSIRFSGWTEEPASKYSLIDSRTHTSWW